MPRNDGGPAFPTTPDGEQMPGVTGGMSLRQYYKAEIIKGLVANPNLLPRDDFENIADEIIGGRYFVLTAARLADRMIEEDEK